MTPEQFVYWLQGFTELSASGDVERIGLTEKQWDTVKDHLKQVFDKRTPDRTAPNLPYTPAPYTPPSQPVPFPNQHPPFHDPFGSQGGLIC